LTIELTLRDDMAFSSNVAATVRFLANPRLGRRSRNGRYLLIRLNQTARVMEKDDNSANLKAC